MNANIPFAPCCAFLALLCVSCGRPPADAPPVPSSASLSVVDAAGRSVSFDRPPRRIAIAGRAAFMIENAVYLFPEARDAGIDFFGGQALQRVGADDFLSLVAPSRQAARPFDAQAGVEQIAATRPDAVLLKSSARRTGDALARIGIPVVFLDLETPAQYERDLAILGQLLAAPAQAAERIAYYRRIADFVAQRTASLPAAAKPRALLLQYDDRSGTLAFSVPPTDWIQTELVQRAGAVPVWTHADRRGAWTLVNLEQIAAWDPDVVFVVQYRTDASHAVDAIRADPRWQSLRAARDNRILPFPGDFCSWDQPDPRWSLGLLWLASRLHPDLFADLDFQAEIFRFYALYGLDADAVRNHVFPLLPKELVHGAP
jgi:iron complex transport system substrate-binding protein